MTHNNSIFSGPKIALFEPDIPQNTAAIIRTCACLGAELEKDRHPQTWKFLNMNLSTLIPLRSDKNYE